MEMLRERERYSKVEEENSEKDFDDEKSKPMPRMRLIARIDFRSNHWILLEHFSKNSNSCRKSLRISIRV